MPVTIPVRPWFKGQVVYMPGTWGASKPVKNARVRIRDNDISGSDLLIDVRTDNSGRFAEKAARDWQDMTAISLPFGGTQRMRDPSDVPIFMIEVNDYEVRETVKAPFGYLGDNVTVPIIVPWGPPPQEAEVLLSINDTLIRKDDEPEKVWETIKDLAEAKEEIKIQFYGELYNAYAPLNLPYNQLRDKICDAFGIDKDSSVLTVNPDLASLIALVMITGIMFVFSPIAAGISIFGICCGLGILLAVYLGYKIELKDSTSVSQDSRAFRIDVGIDRDLIITPPN